MKALFSCCLLAAVLADANTALADPLRCNLSGYRPQSGLEAASSNDLLTLTWDGDAGQQVRLRLGVENAVPIVREIALRKGSAPWVVIATDIAPEFSIASGFRRISNQQLQPLRALNVELTPEVIDRYKWDAFWDAPLDLDQSAPRTGGNPPPAAGVANQPGLPRKLEEVTRAAAVFKVSACDVKTNGARLEASFPGVTLGAFDGRLQFTAYKGTNLLRMEVVASTKQPSVAFKYDAGFKGLPIAPTSKVINVSPPPAVLATLNAPGAAPWSVSDWPSAPAGVLQPVKTLNRLLFAQLANGTIAAFPPPHTFFWAREIETNLGYAWYRKDSPTSFSFGVRQADKEEEERYEANFSLYSAPPGTVQRMPVYFYVGGGSAADAEKSALAFTRGDKYKPLPGYQVMANHFHMDFGSRLLASGSLDTKLPDLEALRQAGINIVSPTDRPNGNDRLEVLEAFFEGARRHSTSTFMILAAEEVSTLLGGHWDLLFPKPVYWTRERTANQPFVDKHPKYGTLYRVNTPAEMMEVVKRENGLIYMPHPRTKGSTGYPDVIKDSDHFKDARYRGVGWRWGMGLDLSEQRLSEKRVLPLLDDMNNWVADQPTPLKFIEAITETYQKKPGDDIYANNPVNYVKVARLPAPGDSSTIVDAMTRGDYFVTSGEVLIPSWQVEGSGRQRTIVADVEWTFPLEFVEVVWGDGKTTGSTIVAATELAPFGQRQFRIPFDAAGKKWVRFAAWDSAGNGALVQPVRIQP